MKASKKALLWAIKRSSTMEEVVQKLGLKPECEEKLLNKMLRFYPSAEDYLKRNESLREMKEHFVGEEWDALKESRLEFIGATCRLMKKKMI